MHCAGCMLLVFLQRKGKPSDVSVPLPSLQPCVNDTSDPIWSRPLLLQSDWVHGLLHGLCCHPQSLTLRICKASLKYDTAGFNDRCVPHVGLPCRVRWARCSLRSIVRSAHQTRSACSSTAHGVDASKTQGIGFAVLGCKTDRSVWAGCESRQHGQRAENRDDGLVLLDVITGAVRCARRAS